MGHSNFDFPDVVVILRRACIPCVALAVFFVVFGLSGPGSPSAMATAFEPFNSPNIRGSGDTLGPSTDPVGTANGEETEEPAALQSVPKPTIEVYEGLERDISQSKKNSRRARSDNFFGVEGLSGLPVSLTAQEWTLQMAENGYWLENDQWADFRAIALAGYLPEIRYWLGGDRWATFDLMNLGDELGAGIANGTVEVPEGTTYVTSQQSYGRILVMG